MAKEKNKNKKKTNKNKNKSKQNKTKQTMVDITLYRKFNIEHESNSKTRMNACIPEEKAA
jgi:hypothetical protein